MHLAYGANYTGPDHLAKAAPVLYGVALDSHLRYDTVARRCAREQSGLFNGSAHGLLDIDMFSQFDSGHSDGKMHVVWDRYYHRVRFPFRLQHLPVILVIGCLGKRFFGSKRDRMIDIA
jgi:hypothetical protein